MQSTMLKEEQHIKTYPIIFYYVIYNFVFFFFEYNTEILSWNYDRPSLNTQCTIRKYEFYSAATQNITRSARYDRQTNRECLQSCMSFEPLYEVRGPDSSINDSFWQKGARGFCKALFSQQTRFEESKLSITMETSRRRKFSSIGTIHIHWRLHDHSISHSLKQTLCNNQITFLLTSYESFN